MMLGQHRSCCADTSYYAGAQLGMTLVELLVAMGIGLGVTLAITSLLITGENHKRTTTSTNDAEQTGAYAFYVLDRAIRGGGSGFAFSALGTDRGVLGCKLNAAAMLPRAGALPAPFASLTTSANLRVAPVLIAKNQSQAGTDVLVVMNGSGAAGGVPRQVTGAGSAHTLILDNSVGFAVNDLALVSQSGVTDCLLEQVTAISGSTLTVDSSTYYTAGPSSATLQTLASSTATYVTPLGNATANNVQLTLYGVGSNRTLFSYDLLRALGDTSEAIADGVDQLHAIYGVDSDGDGKLDTWADPGATGYDIATVMTAPATMRKILAVRVSLVLRSNYFDKKQVSPATLTLFGGLTNAAGTSLAQTVTLGADDQHYRYRVFEFTVPVRNMLLLAGGP
jgi:type IV pilus assembly protein PilW